MLKQSMLGLALKTSICAAALAQQPKTGGTINAVIQPEPQ
jgi:peptide/nickel transport system substrate-binding protein